MIDQRTEPAGPIRPDVERPRRETERNDAEVEYPEKDLCLHALIEAQADRTPDRVAVVFERQQLTFGELNRRADRLARHLEAMGAGPDVPVGLFVERSADMVVGILAILKAGAAYLPIDTAYPRERIAFMLTDARVTLAVTQSSLRADLPLDGCQSVCLDGFDWSAPAPEARTAGRARAENLAYVIYTSGSTGRPKGVGIEHRNIVNYVLGVVDRLRLEPGMNYATVSTIAADLGNTVILPALVTGGCLHVISQERAENQAMLSDYFGREGIDVLKIVPSHLAALQEGSNPERLMPRKRLILGGEASRLDWIDRLRALAPDCEIHNHYGPTECTVGVLTYRADPHLPSTPSGTLPLGRPLPNCRVHILGGGGQPVARGEVGELHIGGRGVARGYLYRPELTAEKFVPDPFGTDPTARLYRTGDLARCLPDGNIEFCGRADDQVKVHGYRIELGEVEQALRELPDVRDAVVLAHPDGFGSNELVAYVVPTRANQTLPGREPPGARPDDAPVSPPAGDGILTPATLRETLRDRLPRPMIPARFLLMAKLPLTANGKIDRQSLPATFDDKHPTHLSAGPLSKTEQTIAAIWEDMLRVERVGLDDDFFDMGGTSLLAIRTTSRIRDLLGVDLPLRTLFERPTARALAAAIDAMAWTANSHGPAAAGDADREELEI